MILRQESSARLSFNSDRSIPGSFVTLFAADSAFAKIFIVRGRDAEAWRDTLRKEKTLWEVSGDFVEIECNDACSEGLNAKGICLIDSAS